MPNATALQARLDEFHRKNRKAPLNQATYERYLREIGYLLPEPADFAIRTSGVDDEIATIAGPQLVVPLSNARYSLNAANARWGSLYDALYGTDAIPEDGGATRAGPFNPVRGARVIDYARALLDQTAPLAGRQPQRCHGLFDRQRHAGRRAPATSTHALAHPEQFVGYRGDADAPSAILLRNHGLHIEVIDRSQRIRSAAPTRPASPISSSRPPSRRSWTSRTASPRSTPRTRSRSIATGLA